MTINTQCSREAANTSFIVFGFYPIRAQTYDLPHSRRVFVLFNTYTILLTNYLYQLFVFN